MVLLAVYVYPISKVNCKVCHCDIPITTLMGIYSGNSGMAETSLSPLGFVLSTCTYH